MILLGLVRTYDVLIETFPPGYLEKIGLGFDALRSRNPRLIHLALTGFGQSGPRRDFRSCDRVLSAFGGQMYVSGAASGPPTPLYGDQSAYASSLSGAVAILLALHRRRKTGAGTFIDLSIQEAVVSTLDHVLVRYFHQKEVSRRLGGHYWNDVFHIFPCRNGHLLMTISYQWDTLVAWMSSEGMAGDLADDIWKDETFRAEHMDHILQVMEQWTQRHEVDELFEMGQTMQFPWAPILAPHDVLVSPQLRARHFLLSETPPGRDSIPRHPAMPYRFSGWQPSSRRPAPLPGEHNRHILGDEGLPEGVMHLPGPGRDQSAMRYEREEHPEAARSGKAGEILAGIRVLDFTRVLAGPYATRMLADFGAEVIKVQSARTSTGAESNATAYFSAWNRNKRSMTLNMGHPKARDIVLRLTGLCDVVIENFSPRVLANWDLSYPRLQEANPSVIVASVSAMGQTGPWRDFVGFGPTFHAMSGLTYLSSTDKAYPAGPGHAYADTIIGLYTALSVLTALHHRNQSGQGQYIDISSYEAVCTLIGPALLAGAEYWRCPENAGLDEDEAFSGCFPCLGDDRWCIVALLSEDDWPKFCRAIGMTDWLEDGRFSSASKRKLHRAALHRLIAAWTSDQSQESVVERLQQGGIAAAAVQNAEDLALDRHLRARDFFVALDHPVVGKAVSERPPFRFAGEEAPSWKAAPLLGADNDYVFRQLLGFTEEDIRRGIEEGLIR